MSLFVLSHCSLVFYHQSRLQVQYSEKHTGKKSAYSGTVDAYRKVYQNGGIRALYAGGVPTMITRISFGWYMWGYEATRRFFMRNNPDGKVSVCVCVCVCSLFSLSVEFS
jgi:Mitochondrial carrier protein